MTDQTFRPEARAPRGFADKRAATLRAERRIVESVSKVYELWGFEPLDTGAFEYADALGKFLPDSDRPNEGVFALQDDDEQWMAQRRRTGRPCPSPIAATPSGRSGAVRTVQGRLPDQYARCHRHV
eukprot:gene66616-biopygen48905